MGKVQATSLRVTLLSSELIDVLPALKGEHHDAIDGDDAAIEASCARRNSVVGDENESGRLRMCGCPQIIIAGHPALGFQRARIAP